MAEKAEVKKVACFKRALDLPAFLLEYVVDLEASVEHTVDYCPPGATDFVFAVGEIWLTTGGMTTLIAESRDAGNLVSTLEMLRLEIGSAGKIASIPSLDKQINLGGWCDWTAGYWDRLRADSGTPEDEAIYDELRAALLIDGSAGIIAAYRHGNSVVVEACPRSREGNVRNAWSTIDPDALSGSIDILLEQLKDGVRAELTRREDGA